MTTKRRIRREATAALLAEPSSFDDLCDAIADDRLTLSEWCRKHDAPFMQVREWLEADEERAKRYKLAEAARETHLNDRLLSGIRDITEVDIRQMYDDFGNLLPVKELPDDVVRAIASVETHFTEDGTMVRKLKLNDRLRGYDSLGKLLGAYKDRVEVSGPRGGPIETKDVSPLEAARRIAYVLMTASKQQPQTMKE